GLSTALSTADRINSGANGSGTFKTSLGMRRWDALSVTEKWTKLTSLRRVSVKLMTSREILAFITEVGIVPVVRCASAGGAVQTVAALYRGGIRAAEITMTVPGAIRALEKVADQLGDKLVLGAGTVLDPETARACMLAGAEFFVTPSLRVSTIEMA